jgi:cation diffusion facilitator CzcD-associated flavoprotein CzcO
MLPGAVAAAALSSEGSFELIRVFERRETAGGTWFVSQTVLTVDYER